VIETEVKYVLTEQQFNMILTTLGKPDDRLFQTDTYFRTGSPAHTLRVREEINLVTDIRKSFITLKSNSTSTKGLRSTDEIEPEISATHTKAFINMFALLGFPEMCTVNKVRREWKYGGGKIVLDSVTTLGVFLEIEVLTEDKAKARSQIDAIIKQFGFDKLTQATSGYSRMIQERREKVA
jgi:predicted adenylyl cyclase CyaB